MAFLKNAWYVAAWANEVQRTLLPRRILDQPVVMYRKEDGAAVALGDLCPHRFAPLHMGRLVGDLVQCGYHGLQFDCTGTCVLNPFDGSSPKTARTRHYPLEERHGLLWIWMGDEARADAALIPDYRCLTDPRRRVLPGSISVAANFELVVDNLADLTHTNFLHSRFLKVEAFPKGEHEVVQEGNAVYSKFWFPDGRITPLAARYMDASPDLLVDKWIETRWDPPSLIMIDIGYTPTGTPRTNGIQYCAAHLLTPETETTTHYFYAHARSFKIDDAKTDEVVRHWQNVGFNEEDKPMIEAQQRNLGSGVDFMSLRPALQSNDAGAQRIRRVLAELIRGEAAHTGTGVKAKSAA